MHGLEVVVGGTLDPSRLERVPTWLGSGLGLGVGLGVGLGLGLGLGLGWRLGLESG